MCVIHQKIGEVAYGAPTPRLQGSVTVMAAMDHMDMCESNLVGIECEENFVGVFRRSDFNKRVLRQNLDPRTATLYEVMTISPPVIDGDQNVRETYELMLGKKLDHICVVEGRTLLGIITLNYLTEDIMKDYETIHDENRMIMNYIQNGESYGFSNYKS